MLRFKKIIIVHGEKPSAIGIQHPDFIKRLNKAIEIANKDKTIEAVVVTGGKTRKKTQAEADYGKLYLKNHIRIPVLGEDKSKTTIENIEFTRKILAEDKIRQAFIITGKKRMPRLKYLYKKIWPSIYSRAVFIPTADNLPFYYYFTEPLCSIYLTFDLKERFIPKIGKIIFRNG